MKIKIFSSLLAFAATFVLSGVFFPSLASISKIISFNSKPDIGIQNKISALLRQDLENRRVKAHKLTSRGNDSDPATFIYPIVEYADKTDSMNLSGLPEDFQIAWLRYARATTESANLISNLKSLPNRLTLDEEEEASAETRFAAENDSRKAMLSIAGDYGVDFQE